MLTEEPTAQHHRYSASGVSGWMTCAGKLVMEQDIPESYSRFADEGSAAHFLAAECLLNNRSPESYHHFGIVCWEKAGDRDGQCFYGNPLPEGATERSTWKVDQAMVDHITKYVDYIRKLAEGGILKVEQRVHFGGIIGVPGAFGTSDTVILSADGTELIIVDLKYGYKEVSAEANQQMQLYALGALDSPFAKSADEPTCEDFEDLV